MKVRIKSNGTCQQTSVTTETGETIPCKAITIHPMRAGRGIITASIELGRIDDLDIVVDVDRILWKGSWWKKEENVA